MMRDKFDLKYIIKARIASAFAIAGFLICLFSAIIYAFTVNIFIGAFGIGLTLLIIGAFGTEWAEEEVDDEE